MLLAQKGGGGVRLLFDREQVVPRETLLVGGTALVGSHHLEAAVVELLLVYFLPVAVRVLPVVLSRGKVAAEHAQLVLGLETGGFRVFFLQVKVFLRLRAQRRVTIIV